jgi:hypothetical protein
VLEGEADGEAVGATFSFQVTTIDDDAIQVTAPTG